MLALLGIAVVSVMTLMPQAVTETVTRVLAFIG